MLNFIKISRTVADKWWFNVFFQNVGRPPSWICWSPTGTTHDDHLVVSIVTPNLVKIDAVVSITWNFQYFARLAWKRLFTPQKLGVWGVFHPPKWGAISTKPPKGTSAGRNGSRGVLIVCVFNSSWEIAWKKGVTRRKKKNYDTFIGFGVTVKWPWHDCMQLFLYLGLYVHTVEDSTLMSTID